jgi:hypothetical protein
MTGQPPRAGRACNIWQNPGKARRSGPETGPDLGLVRHQGLEPRTR